MFGQILTIVLVAIAMVPAVGHAFEYPGKKRLDQDGYLAVQAIYYPGFTVLGISEFAGLIAVGIQLVMTPSGSIAFWLTLIPFLGLLGMQALYWAFNHPANKYWLQNGSVTLGTAGAGFFGVDSARPGNRPKNGEAADWKQLRDRWEYSHIARAALAFLSFLSLVLKLGCRTC